MRHLATPAILPAIGELAPVASIPQFSSHDTRLEPNVETFLQSCRLEPFELCELMLEPVESGNSERREIRRRLSELATMCGGWSKHSNYLFLENEWTFREHDIV